MSRSFLKRKNSVQKMLSAFALFICAFANASDIKYPVSAIPQNLKKEANVVKRMEEIVFEIISMKEAVYHRKVVYTILNENGDRYAEMVVGYDKLRKVTSFSGTLYDVKGIIVKKAGKKDIQDYSAADDISLFEDDRVKVLDFSNHSYPYTVEFETEVKYNNTYFMPGWFPQPDEKISVENSSFVFIAPTDYTIRFKAFNYNDLPFSSMQKNRQEKKWSVVNLVALERPFASPTWNELAPCVYFAPSQFEIAGYKGNGSTWQELGKFQLALNEGRDKLPEDLVRNVTALTKDVTDEKEKTRLLYNFLQQTTRYVSIQTGIGGWQPFEASFVASKGYGDCKALCNYMYSLLKSAGIKSYYALVNAGRNIDDKYLLEDFPSDQFDHVILCVPLSKDTIWLECTNQTEPAGYLGQFTGNRKALLITEEGGKLVSTTHYGMRDNKQTRIIKGKLNPDGSVLMYANSNYKGVRQEGRSELINQLSKSRVKQFLQGDLETTTYEVNDFKYNQQKSALPELDEQLNIRIENYATVTGKRIFIVPNILSRGGNLFSEDERKTDIVLDYEFSDEDSCEIEIPDGYEIEVLPADVSLKTKFGTYYCSMKPDGNKILYRRTREQFSGRFPAKDQMELTNFFEAIYKADRTKIVLIKKSV